MNRAADEILSVLFSAGNGDSAGGKWNCVCLGFDSRCADLLQDRLRFRGENVRIKTKKKREFGWYNGGEIWRGAKKI